LCGTLFPASENGRDDVLKQGLSGWGRIRAEFAQSKQRFLIGEIQLDIVHCTSGQDEEWNWAPSRSGLASRFDAVQVAHKEILAAAIPVRGLRGSMPRTHHDQQVKILVGFDQRMDYLHRGCGIDVAIFLAYDQ
jgi:hypothetical protein